MDNSVKNHAFTVRIDSSLWIFIKGPYAVRSKRQLHIRQLFKGDFLENKALNEQILVFEMYGICGFTKFLLHRNDKWINE